MQVDQKKQEKQQISINKGHELYHADKSNLGFSNLHTYTSTNNKATTMTETMGLDISCLKFYLKLYNRFEAVQSEKIYRR
jgi:hypothetical protein